MNVSIASLPPIGIRSAVARVLEQHGRLRVLHPGVRAAALPPLLDDDAALLVDGVRVERQPVGDVAEEDERLAQRLGVVGRHVQHVRRLVEARVGVHAGAQPHADRFHELHQVLLGEVPAAVERHVLDEVRQAELVVVFEHRPRVDHQPQFGAPEGPAVLPDVVAQAVREIADADPLIRGHRLIERRRQRGIRRGLVLRHGGDEAGEEEQDKKVQGAGPESHPPIMRAAPDPVKPRLLLCLLMGSDSIRTGGVRWGQTRWGRQTPDRV